jgi:hypothetical protein
MAIKELFYDSRPLVLLDPRASLRIDPRFRFTRSSIGTYTDATGIIQTAGANAPRFCYDPASDEFLGLLIEESRTNEVAYSTITSANWTSIDGAVIVDNQATAPDETNTAALINFPGTGVPGVRIATPSASETRTVSCWVRAVSGTVTLRVGNGSNLGINQTVGTEWTRITEEFPSSSVTAGIYYSNPVSNAAFYAWGFQQEAGSFLTSYIPTSGSAVTRSQDLLSIEGPLPATGSIYVDSRAIAVEENNTLLSLKNDSNDKIDLAYLSNTATYNSLALIASYDGASKASLPLPVPTTDRERNIITYGANNYQYGRDSSRFATSLSSSVPTDLNKFSIGHDAVDPTKAFNGYINTVYAWSGELTPEVAEALVRGEIDAIDADNYNPTGPAGSLALVINTQGATASGEKTFTLPAESENTDNDIVITWGDGTESGLSNAAAELGAVGLTHEYSAAGIYPVWVEGKMQNIKYNNISNADDLLLIAEWGTGDMLTSPSTMNGAFYGCSQMDFSNSARNINLPDTSVITDWANAFRDCSSITGTFPSFDFTAAENFSSTWYACSSMTSVPAIFITDSEVTQNVTNLNSTWSWCTSLTSFPLINTSEVTSFGETWFQCTGLTSFPSINTAKGTNFAYTWSGCSSLTSFPLINTSLATNFINTWSGCTNLNSFPLIDTSGATNFNAAWSGCSNLTSVPLVDTSSGTSFVSTWGNLTSLTSFPLVDTSSGTNFNNSWAGCMGLTSFPLIDTSSGTNFGNAWLNCTNLEDFPASFFDSWTGTPINQCFYRTWSNCNLTATSVNNILVSIAASGVSAPSGTGTNDKSITIDYDGTILPGTTATAITTLKSRNWDIYLNGVQQ